jgi:hypothetical protein
MKKAAVPSILIVVILLAVAVIAEAQQPAKVPHIGYLVLNTLSSQVARMEGFPPGSARAWLRRGEKYRH